MKKINRLMLTVFISFCLLAAGVGESCAARLGGGKSFGSRPSYSTPFNRSGGYNQSNPSQQAYQQPSMAAQRNQAARETLGRRGGIMGMLGGLALGGLLGAMFFGGAFEGINFMDILIFAGIAFLLYKLFASRTKSGMGRPASVGQQSNGQSSDAEFEQVYLRTAEPASASTRAGFNTDVLFNRGGSFKPASAQTLPADFDAASFLKGAKAAYVHLQAAWDKGDLAELRGLCTDKVFGELQDQIKQREGENHTELLTVDMELLEVADNGPEREAAVLFDVLLRENPGLAPAPVKEVWHFIRSKTSKQPIWFLDGIQQLEG